MANDYNVIRSRDNVEFNPINAKINGRLECHQRIFRVKGRNTAMCHNIRDFRQGNLS